MEPDNNLPTSLPEQFTPETIVKSNHKTLYVILGTAISLVLILFSVFFLLLKQRTQITFAPFPTPTPFQTIESDLNNWKVYSSNVFGFSFSYPSSWKIKEIGGYGKQPGGYDTLLLMAPYIQQPVGKDYVFMSIYNFPKTAYIPKTNEFEKVTQKEILIDRLSATEYQIEITKNPQPPVESQYPDGTSYTNIYISRHDSYLVLEHVDKDKPGIFRKILSTFKFTDANLISFVKSKLSNSPESSISVEKNEGAYALGSASTADGSGFYWAAAKINNQWSYLMSGNGIPSCKDVETFPVGTFRSGFGEDGKFDICYKSQLELINRRTGLPIK